MAHIFSPTRPGNPNANDNISGIPEFTPIPAAPSPVVPGTDAHPSEAAVSKKDLAPAATAEGDVPSKTPAINKSTKGKRGRPPRDTKANAEKTPRKRAVEKEVTTIYFSPTTLQRLRIMHVMNRVALSDIVSECCDDMLDRSYQCHNPSCSCKFSISRKNDEVDQTPVCCPVCGSDKLCQVKPGF